MSQSKKKFPELPYSGTNIDPHTTQGEISKMLEDYGAENIQWTGVFRDSNINLKFILKTTDGKLFTVEITPPDIRIKRRTWNIEQGKYVKVLVPAWPQSMRLLYWYIETKLKSIHWGLVSVEKEFLSDILVPLRDGTKRKVFDIVITPLREDRLSLEVKEPIPSQERPPTILDGDYREGQPNGQ